MTDNPAAAVAAAARRFVAIAIPDGQRLALDRALAPARRAHPRLRWSRPGGWHITLAFLGIVEGQRVAEATDALRTAADAVDAPRSLTLGRAGRFDRRVLWLEVEDDPPGSLNALATAVRDALVERDFEVDRKPLRAHLTLARSGRSAPVTVEVVDEVHAPAAARWAPDSVQLWRSVGGAGPAPYAVDAAIALSTARAW